MTTGTELGASKMFLTAAAANTAACNLYESLGAALAAQGPTVSYWFQLPATHNHNDGGA